MVRLLVGFHPATRSVQSTSADNTQKYRERKKNAFKVSPGFVCLFSVYCIKNRYDLFDQVLALIKQTLYKCPRKRFLGTLDHTLTCFFHVCIKTRPGKS